MDRAGNLRRDGEVPRSGTRARGRGSRLGQWRVECQYRLFSCKLFSDSLSRPLLLVASSLARHKPRSSIWRCQIQIQRIYKILRVAIIMLACRWQWRSCYCKAPRHPTPDPRPPIRSNAPDEPIAVFNRLPSAEIRPSTLHAATSLTTCAQCHTSAQEKVMRAGRLSHVPVPSA